MGVASSGFETTGFSSQAREGDISGLLYISEYLDMACTCMLSSAQRLYGLEGFWKLRMSRTIHRSTQQQVLASDRGSLNKLKKVNFVYEAYLNGGTPNKYACIVYIYLKLGQSDC